MSDKVQNVFKRQTMKKGTENLVPMSYAVLKLSQMSEEGGGGGDSAPAWRELNQPQVEIICSIMICSLRHFHGNVLMKYLFMLYFSY